MSFGPYNYPLKIWRSIATSIPKVGIHFGVWGFIPSHSFTFSRAWGVILGLLSWPAPLQAFILVMSPRLRLRHSILFVDESTLCYQRWHSHLNQRCHCRPNANGFTSLILRNSRICYIGCSSSQRTEPLQPTPNRSNPPFSNWGIWLFT
jgi:hypothetical protein